MENYYDILNLHPFCTQKEIKDSYKKMLIKYHPNNKDLNNKDINDNIKKVINAYKILSNPQLREEYNEKIDKMNKINDYIKKTEELNSIPDVIIYINVSIRDLFYGKDEDIDYIRYSPCITCNCYGTYNGEKDDCSLCFGTGFILSNNMEERKCNICNGFGINSEKCKDCYGNRFKKENKNITIKIIKGAHHKYIILIKNEGNYIPEEDRINNQERSNVRVIINEINENNIQRGFFIKELNIFDFSDILMIHEINFKESIFGFNDNIKCPFNDNNLIIKINDTIINNDIYVITDKGMTMICPKDNKIYGNLFIKFKVKRPTLNYKQKKEIFQIISNKKYLKKKINENYCNTISINDFIELNKSNSDS